MNTSKKILIILILPLIISVVCSSSINAIISKTSADSDSINLSSKFYKSNEVNVHLLCFVESGDVNHENVNIKGFWAAYFSPFNFCIGRVDLDLICFSFNPEEPRLIIKSFFGKTIYENNVSVSLKGFIGSICPTGSISVGTLKGFAWIAYITPLENQHN